MRENQTIVENLPLKVEQQQQQQLSDVSSGNNIPDHKLTFETWLKNSSDEPAFQRDSRMLLGFIMADKTWPALNDYINLRNYLRSVHKFTSDDERIEIISCFDRSWDRYSYFTSKYFISLASSF